MSDMELADAKHHIETYKQVITSMENENQFLKDKLAERTQTIMELENEFMHDITHFYRIDKNNKFQMFALNVGVAFYHIMLAPVYTCMIPIELYKYLFPSNKTIDTA